MYGKEIKIGFKEESKQSYLPALPIGLVFIATDVMLKHEKIKEQDWMQNHDEKQMRVLLKKTSQS